MSRVIYLVFTVNRSISSRLVLKYSILCENCKISKMLNDPINHSARDVKTSGMQNVKPLTHIYLKKEEYMQMTRDILETQL